MGQIDLPPSPREDGPSSFTHRVKHLEYRTLILTMTELGLIVQFAHPVIRPRSVGRT